MTDANPFYPGRPVDPEFFIGRKEILNAVSENPQTERICLWEDNEILGGRGMGKTSTLLKIGSLAPKTSLISYFPCKIDGETQYLGEFLFVLERNVLARQAKPLSFADLFRSLKLGEKSATSVLIEALARIEERNILLLLDDSDLIPLEALAALKSALYLLRLEHGKEVRAVFASKDSISEKLKKAGLSPAEAFARTFELRNFGSEEVFALLRRSYPWWTEGSQKAVFDKTEGHPLLVQMYGSAYCKLAESDSTFKAFRNSVAIEVQKDPLRDFGVQFLDASGRVLFEKSVQEITWKCDAKVKEALWQWYRQGWRGKPSEAEREVALAIAKLGGEAQFIAIKRAYGRNPGPQIKRAVRKGIIEQKGRGLYALPHPLIAQAMKEHSQS